MTAPGAKRLFSLVLFVLGYNALAGVDELENSLVTIQTRSHHQVRARASRTTRVNLDHAIEHIDDEHHAKDSSDADAPVAAASAALQIAPPSSNGEAVYTRSPQPILSAALPIRAGRAPPSFLF